MVHSVYPWERRFKEATMKRLAWATVAAILAAIPAPSGASTSAAGDTYYPLAKGNKWTYTTDYGDDTLLVHEITGTEKVGEADCFIVEHKTVGPTLGTR